MKSKKSYTINPKEYKEDGLFYKEDISFPEDETFHEDDRLSGTPRPRGRKHSGEYIRSLNAKINKLKAYKRRVESYEPYYLVDTTKIEYLCVPSEYGCKEAYVLLKKDLEDYTLNCKQGTYADYSEMDTDNLRGSKSYLVFSPHPYYSMEPLLADMRKCRLERLGVQRPYGNTIGCLLLNDGEYVFFWPKVLHDQEDDCSVDSATDTQSKGL